jgi:hypothetical protein
MAVYYDPQVLTNQMIYGVVGNYVIGWLKRTRLVPFINANSYWINRVLTISIALISAFGIEHSYSYTADGVFTLTLTGLTFWSIYNSGKQFLVAYIAQQIPYHAMKFRDATAVASISGPPGARKETVAVITTTEHGAPVNNG